MNLEDAKTQPICGLPADGTRPFDRPLPQDNCCHIYELRNMYGTYFNICNDDDDGLGNPMVAYLDSMPGSYNEENDRWTWDNEVSSWKCGKRVDITLCYNSDGGADGKDGIPDECPGGTLASESGNARSGNGAMSMNDTVSKVIVWPPKDRDYPTDGGQVKATFYDGKNCTGKSQMVES